MVGIWYPYHCPEFGFAPEDVRNIIDTDTASFAQLLADPVHDIYRDFDQLPDLLDRYELEEPSQAGHEPGECEIDF